MNTLTDHLALALDPAALFHAVVGAEAEPWQADQLRSAHRRRLILSWRGAGKSCTTAALALHRMIYTPGSAVAVVAPTQRQSSYWYDRHFRPGFRRLGKPVAVVKENETQLRLANESSVRVLPGSEPDMIRGLHDISLLIVDESARVDDLVWPAILAMLAPDGVLVALTTPAGMRGEFYRYWTEGGPLWHRTKVTVWDSGRLTAEEIAELQALHSPRDFAAEYECDFSSNVESFFDPRAVARAFDCQLGGLPGFGGAA